MGHFLVGGGEGRLLVGSQNLGLGNGTLLSRGRGGGENRGVWVGGTKGILYLQRGGINCCLIPEKKGFSYNTGNFLFSDGI